MLKRSRRSEINQSHSAKKVLNGWSRIGCGVDVVEIARFRKVCERGGRVFVRRVFTSGEERYARARKKTALLHLAARFAAKEAVIKAVSQIMPKVFLAMNQIEVRNDSLGRPHIRLHQQETEGISVFISLSHTDHVAVANAIALSRPSDKRAK